MEREWRVKGRLRFDLCDVYRIILPKAYAARLIDELQEYKGQLTFADDLKLDIPNSPKGGALLD